MLSKSVGAAEWLLTKGERSCNLHGRGRSATKRNNVFHKIPKEWILPKDIAEDAKSRRKLTGSFTEEPFDPLPHHVTKLDSMQVVDAVWKS